MLQLLFEQYRWYYNAAVDITKQTYGDALFDKKNYSNTAIRDLIRKHAYVETEEFKGFVYDEDRNEIPVPPWWDRVHNRTPRGASDKFSSSLNSCVSNYRNGNTNSVPVMKYRSRKGLTDL